MQNSLITYTVVLLAGKSGAFATRNRLIGGVAGPIHTNSCEACCQGKGDDGLSIGSRVHCDIAVQGSRLCRQEIQSYPILISCTMCMYTLKSVH